MALFAVALAKEVVLAEEQSAGLSALGLDVGGLLFQVINFGILFVALYFFAFRPLLRVLEERRRTIEESLKSASDIERTKSELAHKERSTLAKARQQAETIITRGEKEAALIREQAHAAGREAADRLLVQVQAQIAQQVASAKMELKREVLKLVVIASERVLQEKIDDAKDRVLVEEAVTAAQQAIKENRL